MNGNISWVFKALKKTQFEYFELVLLFDLSIGVISPILRFKNFGGPTNFPENTFFKNHCPQKTDKLGF